MEKIITNNEINIYNGDIGFYLNQDNKNLSFLDRVESANTTNIENEIKKMPKTQFVLGLKYDPYPALEIFNGSTKKVLELIDKYKCGVTIFTKNNTILKDIPILESISKHSIVNVILKISSTSNKDLENIEGNKIEPKIEVLEKLSKLDINLGIFATPILPFINDDINNMKSIIELALKYNVSYFMYNFSEVIINNKSKDLIYKILDEKYYGLKRKYDAIREEKYKIESPKSGMLKSFIEGTLQAQDIIYDYDLIMKELRTYKRKHKQLSMF